MIQGGLFFFHRLLVSSKKVPYVRDGTIIIGFLKRLENGLTSKELILEKRKITNCYLWVFVTAHTFLNFLVLLILGLILFTFVIPTVDVGT